MYVDLIGYFKEVICLSYNSWCLTYRLQYSGNIPCYPVYRAQCPIQSSSCFISSHNAHEWRSFPPIESSNWKFFESVIEIIVLIMDLSVLCRGLSGLHRYFFYVVFLPYTMYNKAVRADSNEFCTENRLSGL